MPRVWPRPCPCPWAPADADYLAFLALYDAGEEVLPSAAAQREAAEREKASASAMPDASAPGAGAAATHLLAYLATKYAEGGRLGSRGGRKAGGRALDPSAGGGPVTLLLKPSRGAKAKVRAAHGRLGCHVGACAGGQCAVPRGDGG